MSCEHKNLYVTFTCGPEGSVEITNGIIGEADFSSDYDGIVSYHIFCRDCKGKWNHDSGLPQELSELIDRIEESMEEVEW